MIYVRNKDTGAYVRIPTIIGGTGKSAYEIAVDKGYVGSEIEWLEHLKGRDGAVGRDGQDGADAPPGIIISTEEPPDTISDIWINPDENPLQDIEDVVNIAVDKKIADINIDLTIEVVGMELSLKNKETEISSVTLPSGSDGLPGVPGVTISTEEPTDPNNSIWVNPDKPPTQDIEDLVTEIVDEKMATINLTTDESVIENSSNLISGGAVFAALTPIKDELATITNNGQLIGFAVKTQEEYDALPPSKTTDGIVYLLRG